jgi:regulator of sigma E protease
MEYLQALQSLSLTGLLFAFAGLILALFVIIFVHEFGHFIIGRWCGVKIETFSVGFGKELFGFTDRYGTRWKFCLIQLGGYVKFEGDANAASMPSNTDPAKLSPTSLQAQPVWQRMAIVAAGPIANFLLAIAIFAAAMMAIGTPYSRPIVSEVLVNSAAEKAGMKVGDTVKVIDGREIRTFGEIAESVLMRAGETFPVTIERTGEAMVLSLTPDAKELKDGFGGTVKVGILGIRHEPAADEPLMRHYAPHEAVARAVDRTWFIIASTAKFFGKIIVGEQSVKQIGGPISIGKGAGDALSSGIMPFVMFIGFLSISVGIINLFPIPMLDGGHLVFYAIEAVRGKPLGPVAQEWGFRIGFSCVMALMLLGLFNDSGRVFNTVFGS